MQRGLPALEVPKYPNDGDSKTTRHGAQITAPPPLHALSTQPEVVIDIPEDLCLTPRQAKEHESLLSLVWGDRTTSYSRNKAAEPSASLRSPRISRSNSFETPLSTPQMSPVSTPRASITNNGISWKTEEQFIENGDEKQDQTPSNFSAYKRWASYISSLWVFPGVSFRDMFCGRRTDFAVEKRDIEAQWSMASQTDSITPEDDESQRLNYWIPDLFVEPPPGDESQKSKPDSPMKIPKQIERSPQKSTGSDPSKHMPRSFSVRKKLNKAYNLKLLKQYRKTIKGYKKMRKYNESLRRENKKQDEYNKQLEKNRADMESSLQNKQEQSLPIGMVIASVAVGMYAKDEATRAARIALELQRAAAAKAQEEAEKRKAEARRLKLRVEALSRALEKGNELKKLEKSESLTRKLEADTLKKMAARIQQGIDSLEKLQNDVKAIEGESPKKSPVSSIPSVSQRAHSEETRHSDQLMSPMEKKKVQELEKQILIYQEKIQAEMEEKEKIKREGREKRQLAQELRQRIADVQNEIAEQEFQKIKAQDKVNSLSTEYKEKLGQVQGAIKKEKEIKMKAENEVKTSLKVTQNLRSRVQELEFKLKTNEAAARAEIEEARKKQLEAQALAEAAKSKMKLMVEKTRKIEEESKKRESQLNGIADAAKKRVDEKTEEDVELENKQKALLEAVEKINEMQAQIKQLEEKRLQDEKRRRDLHNRVQDLLGNFRVYCRIASASKEGKSLSFLTRIEDGAGVLEVNTKSTGKSNRRKQNRHIFAFDRVFGSDSTYMDVFEHMKPLVTSVMDGHNVTIFSYGSDESGKSSVIFDPFHKVSKYGNDQTQGVAARVIHEIFRIINERKSKGVQHTLSVSVTQILKGEISQTLSKEEPEVHYTRENVTELLTECLTSKWASDTHTLVQFHIKFAERERESTFTIVDLACQNSSGKKGFDSSLSLIGDQLRSMTMKTKPPTPSRNSNAKLAGFLHKLLIGTGKAAFIANITQKDSQITDTLSTLRFATSLKDVASHLKH